MIKERNKFYFTFLNTRTYVMVIADCRGEAMTKFKKIYKSTGDFVHNEKEWDGIKMYYPEAPEEIIE